MATNTGRLRSPEVKPAMQISPSWSTQPKDPNYTESEKSTKTKGVYRFFAYTESDSETEDEDDDEGDQSSSGNSPLWSRINSLSFVYDKRITIIQRKAVPANIDSAMTRHSIFRGIRCYQEFANSLDMVKRQVKISRAFSRTQRPADCGQRDYRRNVWFQMPTVLHLDSGYCKRIHILRVGRALSFYALPN